jgi:hypothetical protein
MTNAMATGFYLTPLCDRGKVMGVKVIVFNVNNLFNNISVILWAVSFLGGGNRSTHRKPLTCLKSLTNFIT